MFVYGRGWYLWICIHIGYFGQFVVLNSCYSACSCPIILVAYDLILGCCLHVFHSHLLEDGVKFVHGSSCDHIGSSCFKERVMLDFMKGWAVCDYMWLVHGLFSTLWDLNSFLMIHERGKDYVWSWLSVGSLDMLEVGSLRPCLCFKFICYGSHSY